MSKAIGSLEDLEATDPEVSAAIRGEEQRQREKLLLIASENFASSAVLAAQGCLMTNKYAEGYPGKRYYGGCRYVDEVESLAIQRAKQLFAADHVDVQPHSGSQANMAAYLSVLKAGDVGLGILDRVVTSRIQKVLVVGQLDVTLAAVEQRRCDRSESEAGVARGDGLDVAVDAEDLLHDDHRAPRCPVRLDHEGRQLVPVRRFECGPRHRRRA